MPAAPVLPFTVAADASSDVALVSAGGIGADASSDVALVFPGEAPTEAFTPRSEDA